MFTVFNLTPGPVPPLLFHGVGHQIHPMETELTEPRVLNFVEWLA